MPLSLARPPGQHDEAMRVCASCRAKEREPTSREGHLALVQMACCNECVCGDCLPSAITTYLENNYLIDLHEDTFVYCPVAPCLGKLAFTTVRELHRLYVVAGVRRDMELHLGIFARVLALREAVRAAAPELTDGEAYASYQVQTGLWRAGIARHIFTDPPPGREDVVEFVSVLDAEDGAPVTVPVFTLLIHQKPDARTCSICAEELRDAKVRIPGVLERVKARDASGDLHALMERFPTAVDLPRCAAAHEMDVCKGCIGRHIKAQLEGRGAAAVDSIRCPSLGCTHVYRPEDIRALAGAGTVARYERLNLLRAVSGDPSFRWCVNTDCGSGALYDTSPGCCHPSLHLDITPDMARARGADGLKENRIECAYCETAMCFDCQSVWHRGLSCEEFVELRERGGGAAETDTWLRSHTKRCPGEGCGVLIEKGNACFHMTCSTCRHEFCWECLADWKKVFAPGGYNAFAHNEGCFFRDQRTLNPSFLRGATIEEAVADNERPRAQRVAQNGAGLDDLQIRVRNMLEHDQWFWEQVEGLQDLFDNPIDL